VIDDPLGAFCRHVDLTLAGAAAGPLAGLRFAAKDLFDVAGEVTGCGNPDWLRTHGPAATTAPAVARLVEAGATLIGKTITDELAFSLNGQNFHYGTPVNVNAPGRIPGGSSSGSAAAVAGRLVDFALGTDTGGSVRTPAALCGIYGVRPTHGRVPIAGVASLAPSFDTVGWFARDAGLLARVGAVLLGEDAAARPLRRALLAADGFVLADPAVETALRPALAAAEAILGQAEPVRVSGQEGELRPWMLRFRELQMREIWAELGGWIEATRPRFGPEIAARFEAAKATAASAPAGSGERRAAFRARLDEILGDDGVLVLPSVPMIAPKLEATAEELVGFRDRTISLNCIAGLAGLPQVTIPAGRVEGCPVGLSLIGPRGSDRRLLELATEVAAGLRTRS
jgi:amidase